MGPVVQQGGCRCPRGRASRPPVLSLAPVLALEVPAPDYLEGRVRLGVSLEPVRVAPEFLPHQVLEGNGPSVRDVPAAGVGGGVHFSLDDLLAPDPGSKSGYLHINIWM